MKGFRLLILIAVLCALALGARQVQAGETVTVMLDWFVNPDHAPLIVAKEKGFFRDKGLDVRFVVPSNPNDPAKLVAAGKADLAVSYQHQHMLQIDQGLPLVRVATLVATPLNCLLVLADSDIHGIKDLKGKTIGYSVGGFETVLLEVMLGSAGLDLTDVRLVNVNFSLSPSLLSGKTDAVIGSFRNFELNQMELEDRPGRAFYVEEYGVPLYDELILVSRRDRSKDKSLRQFVEAVEEGVQFVVNHQERAWELFVAYDPELNDALNRMAWQDTLTRFALRPGALDKARYLRFARFMQEQGMIGQIPALPDYALEPPLE
ncbi:MAG: ABC transporter substrate-binding protein [Thermodesulfobacteriota bacterium]